MCFVHRNYKGLFDGWMDVCGWVYVCMYVCMAVYMGGLVGRRRLLSSA